MPGYGRIFKVILIIKATYNGIFSTFYKIKVYIKMP